MNCPFCGKMITPAERECASCGSTMAQPAESAPSERGHACQTPPQTRELEELLRYTPSAFDRNYTLLGLAVGGLILTSLAVFLIVRLAAEGERLSVWLLPIILLSVGVLMVAAGAPGLVKLATSPLDRTLAVVVRKRRGFPPGTLYFLRVRTDEGETKEYRVGKRLFREFEKGVTGIAYTKGGYLLDFKPVRLPIA